MTLLALVLFAALEFENDNFIRATMSEHGCFHFLIQQRRADTYVRTVGYGKRIEFDALTDLRSQARHTHDLAFGDAKLLSTCLNDCVSHGVFYLPKINNCDL